MTETKVAIQNFYNKYNNPKDNIPKNERHVILVNKLKDIGLNNNSNVLELGCGPGLITAMISDTVKSGAIISSDISPERIANAKAKNKQKNIQFFTSDIFDLQVPNIQFDFITLFDVIEHIPIEKHLELFSYLSEIMTDNTQLLINIPNPLFIEYLKKNDPKLLQIIDQPIYADSIMKNAYSNELILDFFKTYGIWHEDDYQMMLFKKKKEFAKTKLPDTPKTIIQLFKNIFSK